MKLAGDRTQRWANIHLPRSSRNCGDSRPPSARSIDADTMLVSRAARRRKAAAGWDTPLTARRPGTHAYAPGEGGEEIRRVCYIMCFHCIPHLQACRSSACPGDFAQ